MTLQTHNISYRFWAVSLAVLGCLLLFSFLFAGSLVQAQAGQCNFNRNLTIGSRGADVTCLQQFLATEGVLYGNPTGYFGPITRSAVADWQQMRGVTPPLGFFGPASISTYNQQTGQGNLRTTQSAPETTASESDDSSSALEQQLRDLMQQVIVLLTELMNRKRGQLDDGDDTDSEDTDDSDDNDSGGGGGSSDSDDDDDDGNGNSGGGSSSDDDDSSSDNDDSSSDDDGGSADSGDDDGESASADDLTAPNQTSPDDNREGLSLRPSLFWSAVSGADAYELHVSYGNTMAVDTEVDGAGYTPSADLDPDTTYYWRVRALADGASGPWSSIHSFTTGSDDGTSDSGGSDDNGSSGNDGGDDPASETSGSDRAGDEAALEALYASANGDSWDNNSGWSASGMDLSDDIYGVETETVNGELRVKTIKLNGTTGWEVDQERGDDGDLGGNNLSGTLPAEIGNLTEVTYFNVKQNDMSGSVPDEIGGMESLKHLYLNGREFDINLRVANHPGKPPGGSGADERSNNFTGPLPDEIGNLSNLETLVAEGSGRYGDGETGLTGPMPDSLNNLAELRALYVNYNSLTALPSDISNWDKMTHFSIGDNDMNGAEIPATMSEMTSLVNIWIDNMGSATGGEGMTGPIPDLSGLTNLDRIQAPKNDFTGEFPGYLIDGTIPTIDSVAFSWNRLTGQLPEIGDDVDLYFLSVSGNNMDGPIPDSIWQEEQIMLLSMGWNNFTGGIPQSGYPDYDQLKTLYFNNNNLTGDIPCEFWQQVDNSTLKWLYYDNNNFSDVCESEMQAMEGRDGEINGVHN